jgi:hypothetical protein
MLQIRGRHACGKKQDVTPDFDPLTHTYYVNNVKVPHVTKIIAPLSDFSMIPAHTLERARQEGIDIHRTIELEAKNNLDEESLPEWLRPKLAAYRRFVADVGFEVVSSERRVYHTQFGYAGTLDLIGTFRHSTLVCLDIKRSLYGGRSTGLQTAAYAMAWEDEMDNKTIDKRFALVLNDGTYKLTEFSDPRDRSVFLAALCLWKWTNNGR